LTNLTSQSNNWPSHWYLFGSENPECKTHLHVTMRLPTHNHSRWSILHLFGWNKPLAGGSGVLKMISLNLMSMGQLGHAKWPSDPSSNMTNIFLFGPTGFTDILYFVYVFLSICRDGSVVSIVWWCKLLYKGSNPRQNIFFPPWGWICFNLPSTGCNYALLNYLPGTIIVFEALYGVILCRSTWTWRELKLYRVKYYFLMSFRLLWFLKYSQLTIWHLQCSKYI
jgi:hypothetical protein